MRKIVIVGGGFAGLWSAFSAWRHVTILKKQHDIEIVLINKSQFHDIRPRFYEYHLEETQIPLEKVLKPIQVSFVLGGVMHIDCQLQHVILGDGQQIDYDKLILATGSQLVAPTIAGVREHAFNVDTYAAAITLRNHIDSFKKSYPCEQHTIIVVGGGFTGIEVATELVDRLNARVILVDKSEVAGQFGSEMKRVIRQALNALKIKVLSYVDINEVCSDGIRLGDGKKIKADTVVWTAGMQASLLTELFHLELDKLGRLPVDRFLHIQGVENCFAAGDVTSATTDGIHTVRQSCQHAMPQGRVVGHNAVAELFEKPLVMYEQEKYVTCLDLGSWGAVYSEGWDQHVKEIKEKAKKIKRYINCERIYPPSLTHGISELLDAAQPVFKAVKKDNF